MSDQATEQSTEERMLAFLDADEGQPETDEVAEEAAAAEEVEEVTDEAPEGEPPEPRTFKLKRGDEEIDVPEAEVVELAQKGYDYTKKTQAVADERKTIEERAQAVQAHEQYLAQQHQIQQTLIKEVAKVEALNEQVAEYEKVDWNALSDQDPIQAQKLFFQYQQLTTKRQALNQDLQAKMGEAQALYQQRQQQALADGYKQLSKDIPDWNADKAKSVREAVKSYGFSDQELGNVSDPRLVRIMHDAAQYRALQANKQNITNKVADKPPVVKPGGKDAKVAVNAKRSEMRQQLRKTGNAELAAKLIEQML